ncbi:bacterial Ig-like domain-containing protein, partial [Enterococcus faecalis]
VATITVKAIQTAVNAHDSTLYIGTEWQAEDNFDSAIDKDGNPVDFADVTVEGTVDTSKAGTYEVSYSYEGVTSVATITVKAIQTAVNVHDSTLYIGTEWKAEDNFDSAVDKDGNPVDFADVTVEGTVDTSKAGTYEVSYSYEGVTSVATIIIRDKEKNSAPNSDNNKGQDSHNTGEKVLPQTGEQTNTIWTLAGFLTVLLSLIYFVKKRKKSY